MLKAETYGVWTTLGQATWEQRNPGQPEKRMAGQAIHGTGEYVENAWVRKGYVIDASEFRKTCRR